VALLALSDARIREGMEGLAVALLEFALAKRRCAECGLWQPVTIWQGARPTGPEFAAVWNWATF
jgi:hypothetical protein